MTISASAGTSRSTVTAFDDADRRAGEPARHRHLVQIDRQLLRSGEHHHRRAADHDGDRHRLFQLAVFLPVQIAAGAADPRRHAHAKPVGRFQRGAIGAHVADAGFGILGDAQRGGQIGRGVVSRASRSAPAAFSARQSGLRNSSPLMTTSWQGADVTSTGAIGLAIAAHPGVADLLDRPAHADGIDLRRGGQRADRDRRCRSGGLRNR